MSELHRLTGDLMMPCKTKNSSLQHSHPLGRIWISMLGRCYYKCNPSYEYYGGRGIGVCAGWFDLLVFAAYIDKHLGMRPKGHSLDRIDPEVGYVPGNIRWADASTQQRNKRGKRYPRVLRTVEHFGRAYK